LIEKRRVAQRNKCIDESFLGSYFSLRVVEVKNYLTLSSAGIATSAPLSNTQLNSPSYSLLKIYFASIY
jgi:hypothetical protein